MILKVGLIMYVVAIFCIYFGIQQRNKAEIKNHAQQLVDKLIEDTSKEYEK